MPTLDKLYKTWKNKGLLVLGINEEEPEVVRAFYKKNPLIFPTAGDPGGVVREHYGTQAWPTAVIYNRKGRVVAQPVGTRPESEFMRLLHKAGLR